MKQTYWGPHLRDHNLSAKKGITAVVFMQERCGLGTKSPHQQGQGTEVAAARSEKRLPAKRTIPIRLLMPADDSKIKEELESLLRERTELRNTYRVLVSRTEETKIQLRSVERQIAKLRLKARDG